LAWSEGRQPLGAILHSSNEPGELSQWFCHDESTINIGICIIIIFLNPRKTKVGKNLKSYYYYYYYFIIIIITMSEERLSNLAMLSTENERAKKCDISKVVDIFAQKKAHK